MIAMVDDVTRDAALEAIFDEVAALAAEDARAGLELRQIEGPMAEFQTEYEDAYTAARLALHLN